MSCGFRFEVLHMASSEPHRRHWMGRGSGPRPLLPSHETYYCYGIVSNYVIYTTDMAAWHRPFVFTFPVSTFHLHIKPCSHMALLALFNFIRKSWNFTNYHLKRQFNDISKFKCLKNSYLFQIIVKKNTP